MSLIARLAMRPGFRGWAGPVAAMLVGAFLRWPHLGRPHAFVFDETYYAKDAWALLQYGYEQQFVENANEQILAGNLDGIFKESAAYVVHPPFGKWVIAIGEHLFGFTPFGWRFSVALLGTVLILMVGRIVRRLAHSTLIGTIAALLVALDGVAISMSRTALLDSVLVFFVVAGFGAILIDRDQCRSGLARWWRPWLVIAGVSLGFAAATKWSALWHIAFFGLLVFAWGIGTERRRGNNHPIRTALVKDGLAALIPLVLLPLAVYILSWSGWITSTDGWNRAWAATNPSSMPFIPDVLRSLWHYHAEAWRFHVGLKSAHSYEANAWSWPVLGRPTSFFYESPNTCRASSCSQEVIALGNPIIWWAGVLAILHQTWRWFMRRDSRSAAVVVGWAAGWLPWLLFQERTIFFFYSIVLVPFMAAALALSLGTILGPADAPRERRSRGALWVGTFLVIATAATWFFLPIWTAEPLPYEHWRWRMWLPTWI